MNLSKTIQDIHQNAVDHGWWETDRSISESIVLIHSEWSEAVEEARASRPMKWYGCGEAGNDIVVCDPQDEYECRMYGREKECQYRVNKPEGIAVELIDGVIRIFDLFGKMGYKPSRETAEAMMRAMKAANPDLRKETPLVDIVAVAHSLTANAGDNMMFGRLSIQVGLGPLEACAGMVMWWLEAQGEDPVAILEEKHRYNVTRPYKHGKAF